MNKLKLFFYINLLLASFVVWSILSDSPVSDDAPPFDEFISVITIIPFACN